MSAHPVELAPWQREVYERAVRALLEDKLGHALLLAGPPDLGKREVAETLATRLLCTQPRADGLPCGACRGCRLAPAQSSGLATAQLHPDLQRIGLEPNEKGDKLRSEITVDQIRRLGQWFALTPQFGGAQVALIDPADAMNASAGNALLKTLEEPAPGRYLLLVSSRPGRLPATIRSRCQRLDVPRPERAMALAWLRGTLGRDVEPEVLDFAGGAPLQAQTYATGSFARLNADMREGLSGLLAGTADVTGVAPGWAKDGLAERLVWLDLWTMSLARTALAGTDDLVTFPDQPIPLPTPLNALNISRLYEVTGRIREVKSQLTRIALQRELAIEALLIELVRTLRPELMRP